MKPVYHTSTYFNDYHTGVNGVYISPSFSPYPNITFIFCIAEPQHLSLNCQRQKVPLFSDCIHLCQSLRRKSLSRPRIWIWKLVEALLVTNQSYKGLLLVSVTYIFHSSRLLHRSLEECVVSSEDASDDIDCVGTHTDFNLLLCDERKALAQSHRCACVLQACRV